MQWSITLLTLNWGSSSTNTSGVASWKRNWPMVFSVEPDTIGSWLAVASFGARSASWSTALFQSLLGNLSSKVKKRNGRSLDGFIHYPSVYHTSVDWPWEKWPPPFLASYSYAIVGHKLIEKVYPAHIAVVRVYHFGHGNFYCLLLLPWPSSY